MAYEITCKNTGRFIIGFDVKLDKHSGIDAALLAGTRR